MNRRKIIFGAPSNEVQNTMITQQNAELDDLTGSVNHATDKLKSTNKRVAKQLK